MPSRGIKVCCRKITQLSLSFFPFFFIISMGYFYTVKCFNNFIMAAPRKRQAEGYPLILCGFPSVPSPLK